MGTGKKRKNVPTLQDLLDRPICYYCEKDFEDMTYLVDHMKAKHYKCERCGRRLTTAGGLSVHMSQVHKEKLEKIENALPDREKPDIEIFGMEGFPEKLLNAHKQRVTNEYFKREQLLRKETGNPPKGTVPAPVNPQKHETKEEMKARLAEFKAKKAAEKIAAANAGSGSGTNTPPVNNEASMAGAPQNAPAQVKQEPGAITYNAAGNPTNLDIGNVDLSQLTMHGYDGTPYPPSTAYDQKPVMPPQSMYPNPSMSMPPMYPPSYMSMSSHGPNPAAAGPYPPRPPIGMGGSPPPTAFLQGSPPSVVPSTATRQNSLPAAPGLPQRPAFETPNISKEDMAKMHIGSGTTPTGPTMPYNAYGTGPPPPGPQYAMPNAPYPGYPPSGPPGTQYGMSNSPNGTATGPWYAPNQGPAQVTSNAPSSDDIDELIASVTKEKPSSTVYNQQSASPVGQKYEQPELPLPKSQLGKTIYTGVDSESRDPPPHPVSTNQPVQESLATARRELESGTTSASVLETPSKPKSGSKGSKNSKHSEKSSRLIWSDAILSPEEARARRISSGLKKKTTDTVLDQTGEDGQEVTGPVDDSLET